MDRIRVRLGKIRAGGGRRRFCGAPDRAGDRRNGRGNADGAPGVAEGRQARPMEPAGGSVRARRLERLAITWPSLLLVIARLDRAISIRWSGVTGLHRNRMFPISTI